MRGDVRRDIPAEDLALAVMGAVFARALFAALNRDGPGGPGPAEEALWDNLLRLLGPCAPASSPSSKGTKP